MKLIVFVRLSVIEPYRSVEALSPNSLSLH